MTSPTTLHIGRRWYGWGVWEDGGGGGLVGDRTCWGGCV